MSNSQNSDVPNELPSSIGEDEPPEDEIPPPRDYYYDDGTGYEIYRDESEDEEKCDPAEKKPE